MKIDIARQPLVPAFVTLFALAVTAMWGGAGNGVSAGAPENNAPAGRSAGPVSGRISGVGASGRGIHDPLHGNVHGADRHPLQPLWSQHMSADSALRRRRLRHRFGRKLPDGIRRLDAAALAAKNYCRSYCNGYGFDAIFRASLYLGLLPLVYAPATPLVLILPLAILLFRRTFREGRRRRRRSDTAPC